MTIAIGDPSPLHCNDSRVAERQDDLRTHPERSLATLTANSASAPEAPANPDLASAQRLLDALAECHAATYRLYAEALGVPLTDIQVKLQGALDLRGIYAAADHIRPGFAGIAATVQLSSPADIYEVERLRITVERHAPVLDMLRHATPVRIELVLTHCETAPIAA
jgi:putative redox protein